ncbi:MAG TPA: aspartate carbamoyltransferase regulatory subunit [Bacteroidales bacterium]|nr:aspartate carbamoyltransferase regulatory subunit [Bacteroidales bacterium]HRZ49374.1 aspartate carbamoyltransferase regulatory subunit [Bacteroidales bacterium]
MENIKIKELKVSAIENGTVIDHIAHGKVLQVVKILGLEDFEDQIYLGANLESKKYGKKGIIKISNHFFEESDINRIALISPSATIIEIKDFVIVKKFNVQVPSLVQGIVKCINPKCVTNQQKVETRFEVFTIENRMRLKCHYCEKFTNQENFDFN